MTPVSRTLFLWAIRDLIRRPVESAGICLALALCIGSLGAGLLASESLTRTADALISQGPAVVIRKLSPLGWESMPLEPAATVADRIPGVAGVKGRIWGTVGGPLRPLTILGADNAMMAGLASAAVSHNVPQPGKAVVGRSLGGALEADGTLRLQGIEGERLFSAVVVLDKEADTTLFDSVLLHPDDARQLLGLPEGHVSDLAVDVFHDEEAEAMRRELADAFPWPVHVTTRGETRQQYRSAFGRQGGLLAPAYLPALLALCLVVGTTIRDRIRVRREFGLLKAMGWTASDLVTLEICRCVMISVTATFAGGSVAYALVFGFGAPWIVTLVFGWTGVLPELILDPSGSALVLIEVAALVILPFAGAAIAPVLIHAATPPDGLMGSQSG